MKSYSTRRLPFICTASIALLSIAAKSQAAVVVWNGANGPSVNWSDAANWVAGVAPVTGDAPTFDGTVGLANTNDFAGDTTFLGLTFNAGAGAFTLSGNRINSTGGLVNNSLNTQTVNLDVIFVSTHTLNSITGGTMIINGIISGAGGATKTGGGTVTLTHANTYTGATAVNAGTLKLDFAAAGAPATNIINASSVLQMGGGALNIQGVAGGASTQTMASTTFNAGGVNSITVTPGAGGTATLALGNITHNTNAAVRFGTTGTVNAGTVSTTTGGLLGFPSGTGGVNFATAGYATYGLNDFAALSAGAIVGGASVAAFYQNTYGANFDMLANTFIANGGAQRAANVVRWNTPAATTLTAGTSNLMTFTGALITPNMGANNAIFNTGAGGVWQVVRTTNPNGAQQGTIWQNNTLGYFNVSIPIIDGREGTSDPTQIVKAGTGTAVFSGVNTYTGRTSIYEGALMIGADSNLGAVAAPLTLAGGTLLSSATFNLSATRAITTGPGGSGGLAATTGNTLSVGSIIGGTSEVAIGLGQIAGSGVGTANTTAIFGDGIVTLTAANTYSGGTSINAGTLNVNGINALGGANYTGLKIAGGTLQYATTLTSGSDFTTGNGVTLGAGGGTIDTNGNIVSYAAGLTGTGSLTKSGAGTLTLTANGTYTGGTTISGGTLKVTAPGSATGSGSVTVNNLGILSGTGILGGLITVNTGGTIDPGVGVGTLTLPGLTLGFDSLLKFEFNNTGPANDLIAVTGSNTLTINGGKVSVFSEGSSNPWNTAGVFNLFSFGGTIQGTGFSALSVINPASGYNYTFGSSGSNVTLTVAAAGLITNWALATGGSWGTGGNWSNTSPNQIGATANLGSALTAAGTVTLDGNKTVSGLTFDNANAYTVAAGTGGTLTLQKNTGSADLAVLSGSHSVTANIALGSSVNVDITSGGALAVSGVVSGAQSLTKRGAGVLTLTAANTYSTGTTLEAGTLEISHTGALGAAPVSVTGNTTLRAGADALALANTIAIGNAITATVDTQTHTFTIPGVISDTSSNGALTKTGNGTLVLGGANTYGGVTTVNAGILSVSNLQNGGVASNIGQASTAAANLVLNGATLLYNGAGSTSDRLFTIGTAGATLDASGIAALVLSGAGSLALAGSATARTFTLAGANTDANSLSAILSNNGVGATSLAKTGVGKWVLAGANTFSGSTVISGGTLTLTNSLALQNSALNYNNQGGTLAFDTITAATFGGLTGAQDLALANTAAGAVALTLGANNVAATYSGVLSGGGSLTKVGTNTFILGGVNTFTGAATINAGTLRLSVSNALATTVNINTPSGLLLSNGTTNNVSAIIATGSGEFVDVPEAAATATLGGTATTTGGTQYRLGISGAGATLDVTGAHTVGGTGTISFITRGNITFSGSGSLSINTANDTFQFGRQAGQAANIIFKDNAALTTGAIGFGGGQAGGAVSVTLQDNAAINIAAKNFDFHGINAEVGTTVNLNGGTLTAGSFTKFQVTGARTSTLNLNGGTIRAGASNATYLPSLTLLTANVQTGGAKFDTNGFDITVAQPLVTAALPDGGLTKSGTGILTLSGVETYNGATIINAGTLALTGSISASTLIHVKAGATLDVAGVGGGFSVAGAQTLAGSGTVAGATTLGSTAFLSPGNAATAGTLTFSTTLDISPAVAAAASAALRFDLDTLIASDSVINTGTLAIGSSVLELDDFAFTNLGGLANGTYTLFNGITPITGTLGANLVGTLSSYGITLGLADGGNDLVLTVVPEPGSVALIAGGLACLLGRRRRRAV